MDAFRKLAMMRLLHPSASGAATVLAVPGKLPLLREPMLVLCLQWTSVQACACRFWILGGA